MAKVTFHKHEYFSSEDLGLSNPTKFSLHFSHFSIFFYTFLKFSAEIIISGKQNKTKRGLTVGPHTSVGAQLPAPSPAPRHGRGHGHGRHRGGGVPRRRGAAGGAAALTRGQGGQADSGRVVGAHGRAERPRGGARGGAGRPRRRSGEPAAAVGDSDGERVGEGEESMRKLTAPSI